MPGLFASLAPPRRPKPRSFAWQTATRFSCFPRQFLWPAWLGSCLEIRFADLPSWWLPPRARLFLPPPSPSLPVCRYAARRGIIVKGGAALDALARTHTVLFDKTGTLTVGGARLVAVETAPGENADEVLRLAGSLEQASQHVVAAAIVAAAVGRGLALHMPDQVHEFMGSGLEGLIEGRSIRVGSHQLIFRAHKPDDWAVRALAAGVLAIRAERLRFRRRPHNWRFAAG